MSLTVFYSKSSCTSLYTHNIHSSLKAAYPTTRSLSVFIWTIACRSRTQLHVVGTLNRYIWTRFLYYNVKQHGSMTSIFHGDSHAPFCDMFMHSNGQCRTLKKWIWHLLGRRIYAPAQNKLGLDVCYPQHGRGMMPLHNIAVWQLWLESITTARHQEWAV